MSGQNNCQRGSPGKPSIMSNLWLTTLPRKNTLFIDTNDVYMLTRLRIYLYNNVLQVEHFPRQTRISRVVLL